MSGSQNGEHIKRMGAAHPGSGMALSRMAMPEVVVAFCLSGRVQLLLQEALDGAVPIWHTADGDVCRTLLQRHRSAALVVQVPTVSAANELSALIELRHQFPFVSIIGMYVEPASDLGAVARLGAVGVVDFIPADQTQQGDVVRTLLARSHAESFVARIWRMTSLAVDESAATLLRPAITLAHAPITLPRLAAARRMHERSLRKYCEGQGLPSPQWIIGWARTLVIAYYLEEQGRSIRSISALLGFSSPALLASHLRRYTRMTARDLRRQSPLVSVARMLEKALVSAGPLLERDR